MVKDGLCIYYNFLSWYKLVWYKNNQIHRINGPAIIWFDNDKVWYYKGKYITCHSQKKYEKLIKLRLLW